VGSSWTSDYPDAATRALRNLLESPDLAAEVSRGVRARAIELFDVATVGAQWREFLG
jgi:hypothetical protein